MPDLIGQKTCTTKPSIGRTSIRAFVNQLIGELNKKKGANVRKFRENCAEKDWRAQSIVHVAGCSRSRRLLYSQHCMPYTCTSGAAGLITAGMPQSYASVAAWMLFAAVLAMHLQPQST